MVLAIANSWNIQKVRFRSKRFFSAEVDISNFCNRSDPLKDLEAFVPWTGSRGKGFFEFSIPVPFFGLVNSERGHRVPRFSVHSNGMDLVSLVGHKLCSGSDHGGRL